MEVAVKTTDAIHGSKLPTNIRELRFFLGSCIVYRRFLPNFAKRAAPIIATLKKVEAKYFELEKNELVVMEQNDGKTEDTGGSNQNQKRDFFIDTDVCEKRLGYVLEQE